MTKLMLYVLLALFAAFAAAALLMALGVMPPVFFYPVGLVTVGYGFYCYLRSSKLP